MLLSTEIVCSQAQNVIFGKKLGWPVLPHITKILVLRKISYIQLMSVWCFKYGPLVYLTGP